ncbi:XRE family transcriptional regulator [Halocella sp. SP3-1]|uniref:XRE family transcriptional regulator n=1 Tax=Halocella sp. SP3-1 TaxID=2382161 RepID=UPI000F74FF86|nr:XRE family transcriptional regulator [Halocella sp. SP3-1]AZO96095.1 XRE family transcriptional regulator [Halocella sp. SP3-1]
MYKNLEAEMTRNGILKKDIAKCLGVRDAIVLDKMNGKSTFTLDEALKIKNTYFSGMIIEYLFKKHEKEA